MKEKGEKSDGPYINCLDVFGSVCFDHRERYFRDVAETLRRLRPQIKKDKNKLVTRKNTSVHIYEQRVVFVYIRNEKKSL